jgi:intracellular sulfur oxidation DsrE/DsrF family protein
MNTVFHLNLENSSKQSELFGNIKNLLQDEEVETDQVAAVINANAIDIVEKGSEAEEFIEKFAQLDVKFYACSNSLENRGIHQEDVIDDVEIVSSGVGKLNQLQEDGFNYIKV